MIKSSNYQTKIRMQYNNLDTHRAAEDKLFFALGALGSVATVFADDSRVDEEVVTFFIVIIISLRTDSTFVWAAISNNN